jgi:hypothetical protein
MAFFAESGIEVLADRVRRIDDAFYLVGRNDARAAGRKSMEALSMEFGRDLPVIVVDHRPTDLDSVSRSGADILLSGHTHHGQLIPVNLITNRYYELSWGYKMKNRTHVFVTSGIQFDLGALFASASTLALVPAFLAALLLVRGVPALLYLRTVGSRATLVAGLLQATSLPFIVAASMIGIELGLLDPESGAALVAAGLLSVLCFPLAALTEIRGGQRPAGRTADRSVLNPLDSPGGLT